ncbi:lysophospholipid acyltransferase family protein [Smaragdicoccus niigatensis]|uniref:lysophospholipid acyltransferase family protein n=1 Tax=Smaragdicoccus niigatensis TaxID=359359 RepID=UPI00035EB1F0|nr:lysophospholipid acyltransferase family protein [Smaragdicoccus niigatensis]
MGSEHHAWMPLSPCVDGCIDAPPVTVGRAEVVARTARLLGIISTFGPVHTLAPQAWQPAIVQAYSRSMLRNLGVEIEVVDRRRAGESAQRGKLVVASHISWIDGLAVSAVEPSTFVGKADITDAQPLKQVAKWMKLIPIRRESLTGLRAVIDEVRTRLEYGKTVTMFPEGTTWCGRGSGTFRPAIFQAAVESGAPVQPIRIEYFNPDGTTCTTPGFVGDDTIATSVQRLIAADGIRARVTLLPLEKPGPDRRELATRCALRVQGTAEFDFAAHGVLEGSRNTTKMVPA